MATARAKFNTRKRARERGEREGEGERAGESRARAHALRARVCAPLLSVPSREARVLVADGHPSRRDSLPAREEERADGGRRVRVSSHSGGSEFRERARDTRARHTRETFTHSPLNEAEFRRDSLLLFGFGPDGDEARFPRS